MNDKWKYVSIAKCVSACIWSLIGFLLLLIPFTFGDKSISTFSVAPIFGNSYLLESMALSGLGIAGSFGLDTATVDLLSMLMQYSAYLYIIITMATVVFGLVLAIFRIKVMRIIFKIFSIIFGIALILTGISFILYFVGILMFSLQADPNALTGLTDIVMDNGIIFALVAAIFSFIMARKQFGWFSKPF